MEKISNRFSSDILNPLKTDPADSRAQTYLYEYGRGLFKSGNFRESARCLKSSKEHLLNTGNFSLYMDRCNMLIRAFSELGEWGAVQEIQKELEETAFQHGFQKNAKALMVQGFYSGILKKK